MLLGDATKSDADSDGLGAHTVAGFGYEARHQGHWHTATQMTEAFAINAEVTGAVAQAKGTKSATLLASG